MKQIMNVFKTFTILIFGLGQWAFAETDMVNIKGRIQITFSPEYFLIQSDQAIFKIQAQGLDVGTKAKMEKASEGTQLLSVNVPRAALDYVWPLRLERGKTTSGGSSPKESGSRLEGDSVSLTGEKSFSFSDSFALIQVNDVVFRIRKDQLSKEQEKAFVTASDGDHVSLTVAQNAIDQVWTFKQSPPARGLMTPKDRVQFRKNNLQLTGVTLWSASERLASIQANDLIFLFERTALSNQDLEAFDRPGTRLSVNVPASALNFVYSVTSEKTVAVRAPASTKP